MFEKFVDYLYYLLPGPLKKVIRKQNQFYLFFKVIGRLYDGLKADIFRLREESIIISASEELLHEHGKDRDMPRLLGEDIEAYRVRLLLKQEIAKKAGTLPGILLVLRSLGFDKAWIEPYYQFDSTRWAEFIIFLGDDSKSGITRLSVIHAQVMKVKQASSKPVYGNRYGFHQHERDVQARLRLRARVGFYGGKPWYWDGIVKMDGSVRFSGWAGERTRNRQTLTVRVQHLVSNIQTGNIKARYDYWTWDGNVIMDGSRLLDASEQIIKV